MLDPARLAAFTIVTATASLIPGPQMLFVMTQTAWRGSRAGLGALAGFQMGNLCWYVMAALGLGTLATAFPRGFTLLALAGAGYLGWMGVQAIRDARGNHQAAEPTPPPPLRGLRDSLAIALSNPKSLVYVLALLPPFVDPAAPIAAQFAVLAAIGIGCDLIVGAAYILAGNRLAAAMQQPHLRARLELGVGAVFLAIACGVVTNVALEGWA